MIETEEQYHRALERVEQLLDAASDTLNDPLNPEIDQLCHEIEVYERKLFPNWQRWRELKQSFEKARNEADAGALIDGEAFFEFLDQGERPDVIGERMPGLLKGQISIADDFDDPVDFLTDRLERADDAERKGTLNNGESFFNDLNDGKHG